MAGFYFVGGCGTNVFVLCSVTSVLSLLGPGWEEAKHSEAEIAY